MNIKIKWVTRSMTWKVLDRKISSGINLQLTVHLYKNTPNDDKRDIYISNPRKLSIRIYKAILTSHVERTLKVTDWITNQERKSQEYLYSISNVERLINYSQVRIKGLKLRNWRDWELTWIKAQIERQMTISISLRCSNMSKSNPGANNKMFILIETAMLVMNKIQLTTRLIV